MAYELNKTNGILLLTLQDGSTDTFTTSITFVGKNVFNYGEIQNENFLKLLENFSNTEPPASPIQGQIWFDSNTDTLRLKTYDGSKWKSVPTIEYGSGTGDQINSDLWYDTNSKQLFIKTETAYELIGPILSANSALQLSPGKKINGVLFNGSSDISISASTPYSISPGNYIEGDSFNGSTPKTWNIDVGPAETAEPSKVVARNINGDIWFRIGNGLATSARYADLAEKYLSDYEYEFGTVVKIGGTAEITACSLGDTAIGVISKNPGYMMNSSLENGIYVALKGRVQVKITGEIKKGDKLVAGNNGTAVTGSNDYFAISLEDSNNKTMVEALIL